MDKATVLRLLDVNLNRAAEGLRTLEDIARVVREDAGTARWVKSLRHELAELANALPRQERMAARAVHSDAGTALSHPRELQRNDWNELVAAAAERVSQSLRVIEESSKSQFPEFSSECKQLRYRAYDRLAQVELRLNGQRSAFPGPSLYLLVDCKLPIERFTERLRQLSDAGVGLFQIRDKECEAADLLRYSRAAVEAVGRDRVIVNDRVDIALAIGACGVHVGQDDLPLESVQQLAGGSLWIGVSTHDIEQARRAEAAGADYIGCGPTFPSQTKQFERFSGLDFLREVAAAVDLPAYAIGGITPKNVESVRLTGFSRIAVSGTVWAADSPETAARKLLMALGSEQNLSEHVKSEKLL